MEHRITRGNRASALVRRLARPVADHAARRLNDRGDRLDIVRAELRLDYQIDESRREQTVRIAVSPVAGEARPRANQVPHRALAIAPMEHVGMSRAHGGIFQPRALA